MRALIRPTLFMIARLGLFLALLFLLVSQYWSIKVAILHYQFTIIDYGYSAAELHANEIAMPSRITKTDWMSDYWPLRRKMVLGPNAWPSIIPGVVRSGGISWRNLFSWFIGIRHWLVITLFVLFNGVLMWVYRKRGNELASDE